MVEAVFAGAIVALADHAHLGTDMLVSRLGPGGKRVCLLIAQALWCCVHHVLCIQ